MRASEVRAAIVATVTGIAVDNREAEGDRFVHLQVARDPDSAPALAFRLALATQPQRADLTTCDAWIVEYQLSVYHPYSAEVDDVIGATAERLDVALERLHETYADVNNCTCEPAGVDELQHLVASRFSVVTLFRQSEAVL